MTVPQLTKKQRKALFSEEDVPGFEFVDSQTLYMDSHGANITLVVFKVEGDQRLSGYQELFGYICEVNSEFTEFESDEIFEVIGMPVTRFEYERADGEEWE